MLVSRRSARVLEEARAQRRTLPVLTGKRFTPDMIPAGRPEAGEEEVGPACGTDDEWSPEDDGDEAVKENSGAGMVCRAHEHLLHPRGGRAGRFSRS